MEVKIEKILSLYPTLSVATFSGMRKETKCKFVRMCINMKKHYDECQESFKEALERLKGENHDAIIAKAQKLEQEKEKCDLTDEEKIEVNNYVAELNSALNECMRKEVEKEVTLNCDKFDKEDFCEIVCATDFPLDFYALIEKELVEE